MKQLKITFLLMLMSSFLMAQQLTSITVNPTGDASTYEGESAKSYGTDVKLLVKNKKGSTVSRRSYLVFDLSSTALKQVKKATLKLYVNTIQLAEDGASTNTLIDVNAAVDNTLWNETELSWKTAPKSGTKLAALQIDKKGTWYELDLTDFVKGTFSSNKIISLILINRTGDNSLVEISSKEGKNKPLLVLE